MTSRKRTTKT